MHPGIIFLGVIVGSVLFHIFTPWWWTDIASNWGAMDDTINLTFWIGGGVFILVCLFMVYCVFKFSYKEGRKVEYKPEDHKLEKILTIATTVGVIALLAPGLIVYNNYINTPKNALQVEVNAWQWGWQYRLPGEDGILGTAHVAKISDKNPFDKIYSGGRVVDHAPLDHMSQESINYWAGLTKHKSVIHEAMSK